MLKCFFETSKQTAWSIEQKLLCDQYIACIQPCIDYAVSFWGSCSEQTKDLICRLQRRAARIITGNFDFIDTRGADLMKDFGWQTLDIREDYFLSTLMYKYIKGNAPVQLPYELIMTADTHDCNTKASTHVFLQIWKNTTMWLYGACNNRYCVFFVKDVYIHFINLRDILPKSHWLFLYQWYLSMVCVMRRDGTHSRGAQRYETGQYLISNHIQHIY